MHRGLRATITLGSGDGQVRVRWHVWKDGGWLLLASQAECADALGVMRVPDFVADVVRHWLDRGEEHLIDMQEVDLP
jgi:hypothetical protein